jgi:hypothetical protein
VRVEVIRPQRADAAPDRVIGGAVELEEATIGPPRQPLRATGELGSPIDAGYHVDADQRATSRSERKRQVGKRLVRIEGGCRIWPEAVDAMRCDGHDG